MKNKLKKILSKITVYFLCILLSYLLVVNIAHILYLNRYSMIYFDSEFMINIKKDLVDLEASINEVKALKNPNFSGEDLNTIIINLDELLNSVRENKLLTYSGAQRIYLKDLYEIDYGQTHLIQPTLKTIDILVKYDESISSYKDLLRAEIASTAFGYQKELKEPLKGYGYQVLEFDPINMEMNESRLSFRIYRLQHNISKANYIVDLVLKVGANNE